MQNGVTAAVTNQLPNFRCSAPNAYRAARHAAISKQISERGLLHKNNKLTPIHAIYDVFYIQLSVEGGRQGRVTTTIFSCIAVVLHFGGPLQYNAAVQVFYDLQKTCSLLAAVVKNLYCSCIALCGLRNRRLVKCDFYSHHYRRR